MVSKLNYQFDKLTTIEDPVLKKTLQDMWQAIATQYNQVVDGLVTQQDVANLLQPKAAAAAVVPKTLHLIGPLSVGVLEDPYIISVVATPGGGTIANGTYHVGVTSFDSTGESFTGDYVVVMAGGPGHITINGVAIGGADGYNVYAGGTLATAYLQKRVLGYANTTWVLTSLPVSSGPTAPLANASGGDAQAGIVTTSTIPGAPGNFFLNLGQLSNSQSAFFFSDYIGICASFQCKGTGGVAPAGGKTELDVAFNANSVQLIVSPTSVLKSLDIFVNNTLNFSIQATQVACSKNFVLAATYILALLGTVEYDLVNTASQLQFNAVGTGLLAWFETGAFKLNTTCQFFVAGRQWDINNNGGTLGLAGTTAPCQSAVANNQGAGYAVGDRGTIAPTYGTNRAFYEVTGVTGGQVNSVKIIYSGDGYINNTTYPTTVSSGAGNGLLTLTTVVIRRVVWT